MAQGGRYIALVVGRFGEFSNDFVKLRDYIVPVSSCEETSKVIISLIITAIMDLVHGRDRIKSTPDCAIVAEDMSSIPGLMARAAGSVTGRAAFQATRRSAEQLFEGPVE